MRDNAVISTSGPRPTAIITTRAGTIAHFTRPERLADWLAARPGFPFPEVYEEFLTALAVAGVRPAVNRSATVDEALATVARLNERRSA
jgi:hypothetical protein